MGNSESKFDLIIERMQVPGESGLFVLGCFERPATVYMQQVRALNLIYALADQRRSETSRITSILVIGAGAGGMTAAAAAAAIGWKVQILEKMPDVLSLADGASTHRWLHPHIYDWPAEGAEKSKTDLGILDWSAESSRAVADQLRGEWRRLEQAYKIETHVNISDATLDRLSNGQWLVRWNGAGPRPLGAAKQHGGSRPIRRMQQAAVDVVVIAVGFGQETPRPPDFPVIESYWHNDHIDILKAHETQPPAVLISGTGDGGLIDALRYSYKDFRHERVLQKLSDEWLGPDLYREVKEKLLGIEKSVQEMAKERQPHEPELNLQYYELARGLSAKRDQIEFRDDVTVFLVGRNKYPLSLATAPINRFLFTLTNAQYRQGEVITACKAPEGRWNVAYKAGHAETFADVVIRHGPLPELPKHFPDIYAKVKKFRDNWDAALLAERDPTRDPLYDGTFRASLATATKRAAGTAKVEDIDAIGFSFAEANASSDPLEDFRELIRATLDTSIEYIADTVGDKLAAFALQQGSNDEFDKRVRLLVSPPGSGKTALLGHVAKLVLADHVKVPLLLQARIVNIGRGNSLFVNAIETALGTLTNDGLQRDRFHDALLLATMQGKVVLLLDGLDELETPNRKKFLDLVRGSGPDLRRGNCVVLASRTPMTETDGLPTLKLRARNSDAKDTRLLLNRIRTGAFKGSLPERFFELLEKSALKAMRGETVAEDLTDAIRETGVEPDDGNRVGIWLTQRKDGYYHWEFSDRQVRDLLAAMALARENDPGELAGFAFDEQFSNNQPLPMALALAGDVNFVFALLAELQDTVDWRLLILRLRIAKLGSPISPSAAYGLARDTARIVATRELASTEFVLTLADICKDLPQPLASLLSSEISLSIGEMEWPVIVRAIRFFGRADLPDGFDKLSSWLLHENDMIANCAAEALGQLGHENAIPVLLSAYLTSTKSFVFKAAATAITAIGGELATDAMTNILSDRALYHNLRWPAAEALGVLTSYRACDALLAEANDHSSTIRRHIAKALGSYQDNNAADQLARMATDTDDGVRIDAFNSLARRATACHKSILLKGLDDNHIAVQLAAADGLMQLERPALLKALESGLAQSGNPWREHAARLLGHMLGTAASPALVQLSHEADRYARLGAARGLAGIWDEAAIEALIRLSDDDDDEVRSIAIEALPLKDRHEIIDVIVRNLESDGLTLSAFAAVRKLRGFHSPSAVEALRRTVQRGDGLSNLAAGSLGYVGETSDIDLLTTAWRTIKPGFMWEDEYAKAIARIGGERACKALRIFLDHPNKLGRLHALYALDQLSEDAVVPVILHALADSDTDVRRTAANILQRVDFERLRKGLKRALRSESTFVQSTAAQCAIPYADPTMFELLSNIDPAAWGENGEAKHSRILAAMKRVIEMKQAANVP